MSPLDRWAWLKTALVWGVFIAFGPAGTGEASGELRVIHTFPADSAFLAPGAALQATFSSPVDAATISAETFRLNPPAEGDVTYDAPSRTAVFRPTRALVAGNVYTATLTTGVRDTQGNALPQAFSWSFQGADQPDAAPPFIVSAVPSGTSVPAPRNTAIQIAFSEELDPVSVTPESVRLEGGPPGEVRYHPPTRTVTLRPGEDLVAFALYTVTVSPGIRDTAGNGLATPVTWQFQVGAERDTVPPIIVRVSPPDGSHLGVVGTPLVSVKFSETMDVSTLGSGSFFVSPGQPGELVYSVADSIATLLAPVPYDVLIHASLTTEIRDLAGNPLPQEFVWTFRVSFAELDVCANTPDYPGCESGGGGGCFLQTLRRGPEGGQRGGAPDPL